jgi:hypothetical protein
MKRLMIAVLFLAAMPLAAREFSEDCNKHNVTFDDEPAVTAEEMIPAAGLGALRVDAKSGAVSVIGWDESGWSIKACKAAASAALLGQIKVSLNNGTLSATTPEDDAVVHFIIHAPRNASLDVDSNNGPVAVREVNGTIKLNAINGPISVQSSSGTIDAKTVNGPIAFGGTGSGTVRLGAQNGPISLRLDGTQWNGSIEATTDNGPLTIRVPHGYRSGIVADATGHGPISCHAEGCPERGDYRDRDQDRQIQLGSGPTVIRVATHNGPLAIREQ